MRSEPVRVALLLLVAVGLSAAMPQKKKDGFSWPLVGQDDVVTLVNLHPDPKRHTLSSVNYLQEGFIPVCTPVEVVSADKKGMKFRLRESAVEYELRFHGSLEGSKEAFLDELFGPASRCPRERIRKMSARDREGIERGQVLPGMTKAAVLIAVGPPPAHATPTRDLDAWRYWRNRFNTILVHFENGKVANIVD